MKKIVTLVAGVMLAGSFAVFAGCDGEGGSVGKVAGNYSLATSEEVALAFTDVNAEDPFGVADEQDWALGLQLLADLDFSMSTSIKFNGRTFKESTSLKASADYAMNISAGNFIGSGSASYTMKNSVTGMPTTNTSMSATVYNDSSFAYAQANMQGELTKVKVGLSTILDEIKDTDVVLPDISEDSVSFDLYGLVEDFQAMGAKVYLDQNGGLKVKISMGQDYLDSIIGDEALAMPLDFSTFVFDFYIAFDEDGLFKQFGMDVKAKGSISDSESGSNITVSLSGGFAIKAYDGTVTLPEGIADDETYTDITDNLPGDDSGWDWGDGSDGSDGEWDL